MWILCEWVPMYWKPILVIMDITCMAHIYREVLIHLLVPYVRERESHGNRAGKSLPHQHHNNRHRPHHSCFELKLIKTTPWPHVCSNISIKRNNKTIFLINIMSSKPNH